MAAFSLVGLAVTSASVVLYGAPIIDPVELLGKMRQPLAIVISLFGLGLAVVTTNIAANVVSGPYCARCACMLCCSIGIGCLQWLSLSSRPRGCLQMSLHLWPAPGGCGSQRHCQRSLLALALDIYSR